MPSFSCLVNGSRTVPATKYMRQRLSLRFALSTLNTSNPTPTIFALVQLFNVGSSLNKGGHSQHISIFRCCVQRAVSAAMSPSRNAVTMNTFISSPLVCGCRVGSCVDQKLKTWKYQIKAIAITVRACHTSRSSKAQPSAAAA